MTMNDHVLNGSFEEEPPDTTVYIRISLPEHKLQRCLQFQLNETIFEAKQRILAFFGKDLKDGLNYGLYCPPLNGKAGKFLDEERPLRDYPLPGPIGFLEFKYKRRVYKIMQYNPHKIKKQHTKANLKQFMEGVKHSSVDKITKFTCKGLDPNFQEHDTGETPLTIAAGHAKPRSTILALVSGGAHLDFRNKRKLTPMHKAAMVGSYDALKTLLELGASANYRDGAGLTPLYYAVCNEVNPNCVELLLHEKSVVGVQDEQGWAEIHQACRYGRVQHLEHLLFYGADINVKNASGNTALHVCAVNNKESCARVLLFRGADKNAENFSNQTPFQVAIIANNTDLADVIKRHTLDDTVPFREPPRYNERRRSTITPLQSQLMRSRSDPRIDLSLKNMYEWPPSPSFSNYSVPHSASSMTITDMLYRRGPQRSNSISSQGSGRDSDSVYAYPKKRLYAALPGRCFVCVRSYKPKQDGELELHKGDFVEVISVGEEGFWEGKAGGREGWFPSHCLQEVHMRKKGSISAASDDAVILKRNTLAALVGAESENTTICVVLQKGKGGYGFVLRGAKAQQSTAACMEFIPSPDFPALQYLDNVESGGMADKAGLKKEDFVLEINGENVVRSSHERAVKLIKLAKHTLAMKVMRVNRDSSWGQEHADGTMTLPNKRKTAPAPPRRNPDTSLSAGRARAKSMIDGLAELEQALAHYDSDGGSLVSSNSMESLSNSDREKQIASVRSRPTSQKISHKELDAMFARQGSLNDKVINELSASNLQKPTIAVPTRYASPAQLRAQRFKHKRKTNGNAIDRSTSSPNLSQVREGILDEDTDSLSSSEKGIVIRPGIHSDFYQLNGRRVSVDSQASTGTDVSDNMLIPPPPSYPPPLPPREEAKHELVQITHIADATYANVSQEIQARKQSLPVESSFRPGMLAKLNTPKTVTKDQLISHQRNNSLDKTKQHPATTVEHSRSTSLPDHTRIVPGSVHQVAAKFEQNTQPAASLTNNAHSNMPGDPSASKGVTFADDRVFENAARFMNDYPKADMIVTANMNNVSATPTMSNLSTKNIEIEEKKQNKNESDLPYFLPEPDYDLSPDEPEGNLDLVQKIVSENKAITDSWAEGNKLPPNTKLVRDKPDIDSCSSKESRRSRCDSHESRDSQRSRSDSHGSRDNVIIVKPPNPPPPLPPDFVLIRNKNPQKTVTATENIQKKKNTQQQSLNDALQVALKSRQERSEEWQEPIDKKVETKVIHENVLMAAVAKRQSRMKDASGSLVVKNIEKQIQDHKKEKAVISNDPQAVIAAAVAKRRTIIDSGDTSSLADKIEQQVAKSKKIQSVQFGRTVDNQRKENQKEKDAEIKAEPQLAEINKTPKVPPSVPVKTVKKISDNKNEEIKIGDEKQCKEVEATKEDVLTDRKASSSVKFSENIENQKEQKFTTLADQKLQWLKRRLSQTVDKTDVEAAEKNNINKELTENKTKEHIVLGSQLSVDIDGVTTDYSTTDLVQDSANELSAILKNTNNKISQLSPKPSHKKDKDNNLQEKSTENKSNGQEHCVQKGKVNGNGYLPEFPFEVPPPLDLDDPSLIETNIDEDIEALPPPPEFLQHEMTPSFKTRSGCDALPPTPNQMLAGRSDDTVSVISMTSTVSTLSSDNGGFEASHVLPPLFEYSSQNFEQLAPPPPMEFGDYDPSVTSSGYGSVINGEQEPLYEEVQGGYQEFIPPPEDFIANELPPSDGSAFRTVIQVNPYEENVPQPIPVKVKVQSETSKSQTYRNKPIETWSCDDVSSWLMTLNLSDYKDSFVENSIDGLNLVKLTKDEFKELGVTKLGHRMNLERAIREYQGVRL